MIRIAGLAVLASGMAACSPAATTPPDAAEQARFAEVCTERFTYGVDACACLSQRAAQRFDAAAYTILIESMTGEPIRSRMEAAGLSASEQGAVSRFVAETALSCSDET